MTNNSDTTPVQEAETAKRHKWALSDYGVNVGQLVAGIMGVILAAAGLWAAIYVIPRYSLAVVTLTRSSLVNIAGEISGDVQVLYQGNPVPNLILVETKLENTGNQPIRSSDFDRPLEFVFPEGAQVVAAKVIDSRLLQFPPPLSIISNTVQLEPHLLNPQARLVIQFVVVNSISSATPLTYTVRSSIANILDTIPVDAVETDATMTLSSLLSMPAFYVGILLLGLFVSYLASKIPAYEPVSLIVAMWSYVVKPIWRNLVDENIGPPKRDIEKD